MKQIALKAALLATPIACLALVASLTFATSAPDGDLGKKPAKEKVAIKAKFPEQSQLDTYLTSVRSFMLIPPRDGRFGASRVPTLHGSQGSGIPGYKDIEQFKEKDMAFWSYVGGKMPQQIRDQILKGREDYRKQHPDVKMTNYEIPVSRITPVHAEIPQNFSNPKDYGSLYNSVFVQIRDTEELCRKEGYDTYANSFTVGGKEGWILAKSVRASEKSCYSCHSETKEGEPIGYVLAAIVMKGP